MRTLIRGLSQLAITVGAVLLLVVVYQVWVTDLFAHHAQQQASERLRDTWAAPSPQPVREQPDFGLAFAFLHIPRFGAGYARPVIEGTNPDELAEGVGHYVHSALPGQPGNFAVAGHRVGTGSPFLDLDTLRVGDAVVVETVDTWYVYRVSSSEIVDPSDTDVVAPTPDGPLDGAPTGAFLTMTTCNPKFSARQRLVVHAVLAASVSKAAEPAGPPALVER